MIRISIIEEYVFQIRNILFVSVLSLIYLFFMKLFENMLNTSCYVIVTQILDISELRRHVLHIFVF